jgi:putative DNA primase/helicase
LKAITGGESITGDRKYEHSVKFEPTFKVILSGNNEPTIPDSTDAAWRRLKKIPFTTKIQNPIGGYEDTFIQEYSGILNWLIEGCLRWQKEGLQDPDVIRDATSEYRENQDALANLLNDLFDLGYKYQVPKKEFKKVYLEWCDESSTLPLNDKELKKQLLAKGFKDKNSNGLRIWQGLRLKSTDSTGRTSNSPNFTYKDNDEKDMKNDVRPVRSALDESETSESSQRDDVVTSYGDTAAAQPAEPATSVGVPIEHMRLCHTCGDILTTQRLVSEVPECWQCTGCNDTLEVS